VAPWFNPAAGRIRSGEIDTAALDADAALPLAEPPLFRRPLIAIRERRSAGLQQPAPRRPPATGIVPDRAGSGLSLAAAAGDYR
jgi:hypothetical protein